MGNPVCGLRFGGFDYGLLRGGCPERGRLRLMAGDPAVPARGRCRVFTRRLFPVRMRRVQQWRPGGSPGSFSVTVHGLFRLVKPIMGLTIERLYPPQEETQIDFHRKVRDKI